MNLVLHATMILNDKEPSTFEEAISSSYAKLWIEVMSEEMNSLQVNET